MSILVAAVAVLFLLLALVWLAGPPFPRETSEPLRGKIEDLLPLHTHHFPQLRQALTNADEHYIRRKASKELQRMWRAERRQILHGFLTGLAGDYARLKQLARVVESLGAQPKKLAKMRHIWLSFCFRLNYRFASLNIRGGGLGSMRQLARLTDLVGDLSAETETAMTRLEPRKAQREMGSSFHL
jgi:hypothetical protein